MTPLRFVRGDPEEEPASALLAEMGVELIRAYERAHDRLDQPALDAPPELRAPRAAPTWSATRGSRPWPGAGCGTSARAWPKSNRVCVRPAARSRRVAGALLAELEDTARALGYDVVRLDTGPKQVHALSLYRGAGYVEVPRYNENPFASFWAEKRLR